MRDDSAFEGRLRETLRKYTEAGVPYVDQDAAVRRAFERTAVGGALGWFPAAAAALAVTIAIGVLLAPRLGTVPLPPGSSAEATAEPSLAGSVAPSPSSAATATSPAGETPTHSASSLTEEEKSHRFWGSIVRFRPGGYDFGTLEEIAGGSHLIVVGRIVGRASGTSDPEGFPQFGVIAVDQSLKGVPMSLDGQTILVKDLVVESISDEELPAGQVILFLKNYAQMRIDEGLPPAEDPNDTYQYFLPNRYQSFVRSVSGIVVIIDGPPGWWAQYGPFPSDFDGRPVDALLAAIESATQ